VEKQVVEGNDPHGGHGCECEEDTVHVGVSCISFTFTPVASMCVVALHNLFLQSDSPLPSPSFLLAQAIFKPNLFLYKYPNTLYQSFFILPTYEDRTDTVFPNVGI